ncbi:unannotated protein [freshwater metagenome]|uniref:Unannotated protein n=1 Tax=freshwater metagenome TaxID=449393 RepID=A0A6J7BXT8_9ZZZZ|nr:hypothetical protein [Actinomycetota bacterium]
MSTSFGLSFQPPAYAPRPESEIEAEFELDLNAPDIFPPDSDGAPPLRMTKGARASTNADGITDQALRETIANPEDIEPDAAGQGRLRLRRGSMIVVVARDGMILSVRDRKGRRRN